MVNVPWCHDCDRPEMLCRCESIAEEDRVLKNQAMSFIRQMKGASTLKEVYAEVTKAIVEAEGRDPEKFSLCPISLKVVGSRSGRLIPVNKKDKRLVFVSKKGLRAIQQELNYNP